MVKRGEKYEDESIHLLKLTYTDLVFHHEMEEIIFTFFLLETSFWSSFSFTRHIQR